MRYVTYPEIAAAVDGMPISLTEAELIRVGKQTLSTLKYIRLSGRRSPAMWRLDDLQSWFARRYRNAPELIEEFDRRMTGPCLAEPKRAKRARE